MQRPQDHTITNTGVGAGPLQLAVLSAQGSRVHPLVGPARLTIGRAPEATIVLADPRASRLHLEIVVDDQPVARDLQSRNGTRLGGRLLAADERVTLRAGDVLAIGGTLLVVQTADAALAPAAPRPLPGLVLADPTMIHLAQMVERVAPGMISVLLLGETGVGKEIFAELLHRASPRAQRPLLRLHCAALAENLLESELFGHEKGAFTGANAAKPGLLETADGGTVFLDEIGEMPASVQVKLLRVLEEHRVTRVGGLKPRAIDVRVVAATHRDMQREVEAGRFRQDLYFRLSGITLEIPPLRARPAELEPLARHFLAEGTRRAGRSLAPRLGADALAALRRHSWPGNLRELRNVMERAVLLAGDGPIAAQHVAVAPPPAPPAPPAADLRGEVAALERQRIVAALERCAGNQTRAAELLGMPRRTLVNRLAEYGIHRPRKAPRAED